MTQQQVSELLLRARIDEAAAKNAITRLGDINRQVTAIGTSSNVTSENIRQKLDRSLLDLGRNRNLNLIAAELVRIRQEGGNTEEAMRSFIRTMGALGVSDAEIRQVASEIDRLEGNLGKLEAKAGEALSTQEQFNASLAAVARGKQIDSLALAYGDMRQAGLSAEEATAAVNKQLEKLGANKAEIDRVAASLGRVDDRVSSTGGTRRTSQSVFGGRQLGSIGRIGQELWLLPDIGPSTEIARSLRLVDFAQRGFTRLSETVGGTGKAAIAGVAGFTAIGIGIGIIVALADEVGRAGREAKADLEAALATQRTYHEAITTLTTEQAEDQIKALQRTRDALRGQISETEPVLQSTAFTIDEAVFGIEVADLVARTQAWQQMNEVQEKNKRELSEVEQTLGRLQEALRLNQFAAQDAEAALRKQAETQIAAIESDEAARARAQDLVATGTADQWQQAMTDLASQINTVQATIMALLVAGTDESIARAGELQLQLNRLQSAQGILAGVGPTVAGNDAARQAALRADEQHVAALEQSAALTQQLADLISSSTTDQIQDELDRLAIQQNALQVLRAALQPLAATSEAAATALKTVEDRLAAIPGEIVVLQTAAPFVLNRETTQALADATHTMSLLRQEASAFAADATTDELGQFLSALRTEAKFLSEENADLLAQGTDAATALALLNFQRINEIGLIFATYDSLRGQIEAQEELRRANEEAVTLWDERVALEQELSAAMREGSTEAVDERIAAIKAERLALLANLPILEQEAIKNAEAAERLEEVNAELDGLNRQLDAFVAIRPQVAAAELARETKELADQLEKDIDKIEAASDVRIGQILLKQRQKEEDALVDRNDALADLDDEAGDDRLEAEEERSNRLNKLLADLQKKREQIERQFARDSLSAIANRDAAALDAAEDRRDEELENLKDEHDKERREINQHHAATLRDIERNLEKQRQVIDTKYRRQLRDAEIQARREIEAERAQAEREISLRRNAAAEEERALNDHLMAMFGQQNAFWSASLSLAQRSVGQLQGLAGSAAQVMGLGGSTAWQGGLAGSNNPNIVLGSFHEGGSVPRDGLYDLREGEVVGWPNEIGRSLGGIQVGPISVSGNDLSVREIATQVSEAVFGEVVDAMEAAGWGER